jgi:hypothetical protein
MPILGLVFILLIIGGGPWVLLCLVLLAVPVVAVLALVAGVAWLFVGERQKELEARLFREARAAEAAEDERNRLRRLAGY